MACLVLTSMAAITWGSRQSGKWTRMRCASMNPGMLKVLPMETSSPSSASTTPAGSPEPSASSYSSLGMPMMQIGFVERKSRAPHGLDHPPSASCTPGAASVSMKKRSAP